MMNNSRSNRNKIKYRHKQSAGFTMAELLVVVAIIGILAGVSFIAVQTHQKSMTQLQYDTIAKEIFVAAQNHLTLAKSENYQDTATLTHSKGTAGQAEADQTGTTGETVVYNNDIFYFTNSNFTMDGSSILDQMLPFGSVELVTGGSFIIRYQPNAARVLDVFYWTDGDDRYDANLSGNDYVTLIGNAASSEDRHKNYNGNGILGWCGGEDIVKSGEYLEAPEIKVINKEMLLVNVIDPNTGKTTLSPKLKLIVTGMQSGAKIAIPLTIAGTGRIVPAPSGKEYNVVLDDITTKEMHFSELMTKPPVDSQKNNKSFIAGENITIQAVAYSNDVLTSVAYSGEWTTNSLFEEVTEDVVVAGNVTTKTAKQVKISNIRHLENLNDNLSSVEYSRTYFNSSINAVQTVELDWDAFKTALNALRKERIDSSATETDPINIYDKNNKKTKDNCFLPVSSSYTLSYDGQSEIKKSEITGEGQAAVTTEKTIKDNHSIKGIKVDNVNATGSDFAEILRGGVFGSLANATIKNLSLIDTSVTLASGDVGALAGTLKDTAVTNVVAYHTGGKKDTAKITATSGNAGGLIGSIDGTTTVSKSAAALIVSATGGNAGGLIGTVAGGTVTDCYSGGHAIDDPKGTGAVVYNSESGKYNVTATGIAGGLIGNAGNAKIENCYSTCSVEGNRAGGLVGNTSGDIDNCYSTGLVSGLGTNPICAAFAVVASDSTSATIINSKYFEIINELATIKRGSSATEMTVQMSKVVDGDDIESIWYMEPVKKSDGSVLSMEDDKIIAIDYSATKYDEFCGSSTGWKPATPYEEQTKLNEYYGRKYNLQTVAQLDTKNTLKVVEQTTTTAGVTTPADFVATHYGDWPAPEIFVINTASGS